MQDIKQDLCQLAQQQGLASRAKESCKTLLIDEQKNQGFDDSSKLISDFDVDDIELKFDRQAFVFKNRLIEYQYIDTQLGLYVQTSSGVLQVGHYRLITRLDGEYDDDYLVFYPNFEELERRKNNAG